MIACTAKVWVVAALVCAFSPGQATIAADHSRVMFYADEQGREHPVTNPQEWERRRRQILAGMQEAMGALPDRTRLPALDMKITESVHLKGFTRQTISFVAEHTDHEDRIPAYLLVPDLPSGKR